MKTAAMIVIKKATETVTIVGIAQRGRESFCSSSFRASTAFFSAKFAIPEDIVFDRSPGVGPVDNFPDVGHSVVVVVPDVGDPVADNVGDPKVDIAPNSENPVVDTVPEACDPAVDIAPNSENSVVDTVPVACDPAVKIGPNSENSVVDIVPDVCDPAVDIAPNSVVDIVPEACDPAVDIAPRFENPVVDIVLEARDPAVEITPNSENPVVDIVPEAGDIAVDSDPLVGDCVSNNIRIGIILFSFSCSYITFSNNRNSWSGVSAKTGEKKIRLLNACSSKMSLSIYLHYIFFDLRAKTVATC